MKKFLVVLGALSFCVNLFSADEPNASVAARGHYGEIGRRIANLLPRHHILKQKFNDEMSQRAWTNIVTYYDFDHSVFLKSDLDLLQQHEFTIDDELRAGNVEFGYKVHRLYSERIKERIHFATNLILKGEWDFTKDESYGIKRKDAPWPNTREEAEELWRKRIKNELLAIMLVREIEAEDAKKKEKEGRTEKKEADGDEFKEPELTPERTLLKKYAQYCRTMTSPDAETVLQFYLSAVCRAYDPHTDYLSPMSEEDFEMSMNLKLCGVGAVLSLDDGALKIAEVMPGGPMDVDGRIKKGDKIVAVRQGDGEWEDIMWQPMNKTVRKIRGEKGSRVTLEVIPRGDSSGAIRKRIELVRDEIKLDEQAATGHVEKVSLAAGELKLGYVHLPSFYGTMGKKPGDEGFLSCAGDVAKYLAQFNAEDVAGLVLDFRGNGGGSLKEAVLLSSLFVGSGPVVVIQDRITTIPLSIPHGNPVAFKKPIVCLIDRASASASEIVAGHLRDTGRAVILGDVSTHGKGTVQTVMDINRNGDEEQFGSLKITNARFYRINGDSTQVKGVASDVHLPSILDHLDIGEDKLPNALPFSRLRLTPFKKVWNLDFYVPELVKRSKARTADNEKYAKHSADVARAEAIYNRTEVPLEREARKKLMRSDKKVEDAAEEEDEIAESVSRKKKKKGDDVVLEEAYKVLSDLVELTKGEEIPLPKVNWYDVLLDNM